MPTERETRNRMVLDTEALRVCKAALIGSSKKHPKIVETDTDEYGGVLIPRDKWTAAVKALAEYEEHAQALGGVSAADIEMPEEKHAGDEAATFAALDKLRE